MGCSSCRATDQGVREGYAAGDNRENPPRAFEKAVRDFGWLPDTLAAAESWRQEFTALRRQRLSGRYPFGTLPIRVLERERDSSDIWHAQQVQLAALSSEGTLIKAGGSGHMIHIERPDLVVQAILDLVREIRRGK